MYEVPIIAWAVALGLALTVLGFCSYEVGWKARRLRRDALRLRSLDERITRLQQGSALAQERLAGLRGAAGSRR